jgi:HPt (histidine-containing phosphotransfer) domain-containing protein
MTGAEDRMARLKHRFVERSRGDREALVKAFGGVDREELRRLAHSLSGAGGIFGFEAISQCAARLEHGIDREEPPERLRELLDALLQEIDSCR